MDATLIQNPTQRREKRLLNRTDFSLARELQESFHSPLCYRDDLDS